MKAHLPWRILAARAAYLLVALAALLLTPGSVQANSITSPDPDAGLFISLALDAVDNPVVSYYDADNRDLRVLHCNDPNCAGGDESIAAPDTSDVLKEYLSLALDTAGSPVVSYYDAANGDLKVLHCNDANCAGGDDSITSPDTEGNVGMYTSLALDAAGNPVVGYYDADSGDLKVLHCNDANCAGGDESITSPDTEGNVGMFTSLALDAAGNPVVSYAGVDPYDLKVLHCNDANCAGGNESIASLQPGGGYTSLVLDSVGNPVVSFGGSMVLHCGNPDCMTNNNVAFLGGNNDKGDSLALEPGGNPVVSFCSGPSYPADLTVVYCGDANCSSNTMARPDTGLWLNFCYLSLALDRWGYPVVSYFHYADFQLRLLHCGNPTCDPAVDSAVGGIAELPAPAGSSSQQADVPFEGSGRSAETYAALAGGLAAAAVLIGAGGWYARKRWLR